MSDHRWRDLGEEIEADFAAHARPPDAKSALEIGLCLSRRSSDPQRNDQRNDQRAWAARIRRRLAAASRPPCPHCGTVVKRTSKNGRGSEPMYCSHACMKRAAAMRWWNKDKARANDLRRARRRNGKNPRQGPGVKTVRPRAKYLTARIT